MTRDDELDILSRDTQDALADTTITVRAKRPAGRYDPVTRKAPVDLDAPEATDIAAIVDADEPSPQGDKRTRRRGWIVLAEDLPFAPSLAATVEEDGETWPVVSVQRMTDRRDWRIVGERAD